MDTFADDLAALLETLDDGSPMSPLYAHGLRNCPERTSNLRLVGGGDEFELPVPNVGLQGVNYN